MPEGEARTPVNEPTPLLIAIDGPAGAGKSTVASLLAERLGVPYLDTGAMYRAVALMAIRAGIEVPLDDADVATVAELATGDRISVSLADGAARILVDGEDVGASIRTPECSSMASAVSAVSIVRRALVTLQQRLGRRNGGVLEGRDIGTVVFPDADLKVFLTASGEERAQRRFGDLQRQGVATTLQEVRRKQDERDRQDSSRTDSPLAVASGSVVVDSTGMSPNEVVDKILNQLEKSRPEMLDSKGANTVRSRNHRG